MFHKSFAVPVAARRVCQSAYRLCCPWWTFGGRFSIENLLPRLLREKVQIIFPWTKFVSGVTRNATNSALAEVWRSFRDCTLCGSSRSKVISIWKLTFPPLPSYKHTVWMRYHWRMMPQSEGTRGEKYIMKDCRKKDPLNLKKLYSPCRTFFFM